MHADAAPPLHSVCVHNKVCAAQINKASCHWELAAGQGASPQDIRPQGIRPQGNGLHGIGYRTGQKASCHRPQGTSPQGSLILGRYTMMHATVRALAACCKHWSTECEDCSLHATEAVQHIAVQVLASKAHCSVLTDLRLQRRQTFFPSRGSGLFANRLCMQGLQQLCSIFTVHFTLHSSKYKRAFSKACWVPTFTRRL